MWLALLASTLTATWAAEPVVAQGSPPPASEALVDRLVSVLPDRPLSWPVESRVDPTLIGILGRLNPGREEEIRTVLTENQICVSRARNAFLVDFIKRALRSLGDDKVRRMIDLFTGPDLARLKLLILKTDKRQPLSPTESEELAALKNAYPIDDYYWAIKSRSEELADLSWGSHCRGWEELERRGMRIRSKPPPSGPRGPG